MPVYIQKAVTEPVAEPVVEPVPEVYEEQVEIYLARKAALKDGGRSLWSVALYNESRDQWRTYAVRKLKQDAPSVLKLYEGYPGDDGFEYNKMGSVSSTRARELCLLCEAVPVRQSDSGLWCNREYINDLEDALLKNGFVTPAQRKRTLRQFRDCLREESVKKYPKGKWSSKDKKVTVDAEGWSTLGGA